MIIFSIVSFEKIFYIMHGSQVTKRIRSDAEGICEQEEVMALKQTISQCNAAYITLIIFSNKLKFDKLHFLYPLFYCDL